MIEQRDIRYKVKSSEWEVLQILKNTMDFPVYKTLSECRRVYGNLWINEKIKSGELVGVERGNRLLFKVEDIIEIQEKEMKEAIEKQPRAIFKSKK